MAFAVAGVLACGSCALRIEAAQSQNKRGPLPGLRPRPDFAFVRLHDLIDDRQTESGAAFKVGLERLEDFLDLLRRHSRIRYQ